MGLGELNDLASEHEMTIQQLPDGQIMFIPLKDGRAMTPEEVDSLIEWVAKKIAQENA